MPVLLETNTCVWPYEYTGKCGECEAREEHYTTAGAAEVATWLGQNPGIEVAV